ncbi:Rieske (2Fe-2S) protein [Ktedonosporobacter rubrisoli]|uniref:Rieske (2Fe-2S) protein n=1 Tax=Ktedonosporobacter rubrisoli TaxID=2509675 RepID=A0A4P6JT96_KTERU|nr:Rieske (2Fe-2S) protein [Ktedonosporobacter rubrisoli]QBD78654.1 Rieske (2Fe-2S) protein [Ktedonosporobacter rubrisoli]
MKYRICSVEDVPAGEKRSYTIKNVPVVLIHSKAGEFYALYGRCPHQRAALGEGVLCGLTAASEPGEPFQYLREGEIIRCPWHGFSYDVKTGSCLAPPDRLRVKTYPVTVEQHAVFLDL